MFELLRPCWCSQVFSLWFTRSSFLRSSRSTAGRSKPPGPLVKRCVVDTDTERIIHRAPLSAGGQLWTTVRPFPDNRTAGAHLLKTPCRRRCTTLPSQSSNLEREHHGNPSKSCKHNKGYGSLRLYCLSQLKLPSGCLKDDHISF